MFNRFTPEPGDLYDFESNQLPEEGKQVKVVCMFPSRDIKHWNVIAEMWDKKSFGKGKRLYNQEFTKGEKKVIAKYHTKIYRWYLITGHPDYVSVSLRTFDLINRAANFFASL